MHTDQEKDLMKGYYVIQERAILPDGRERVLYNSPRLQSQENALQIWQYYVETARRLRFPVRVIMLPPGTTARSTGSLHPGQTFKQ